MSCQPCQCLVVTFNVGKLQTAHDVTDSNLCTWFNTWSSTLPDIVVICLQETSLLVQATINHMFAAVLPYQLQYTRTWPQGALGFITISVLVSSQTPFSVELQPLAAAQCNADKTGNQKGFVGVTLTIDEITLGILSIHLPVFHGIDIPNACVLKALRMAQRAPNIIIAGDWNYRTVPEKDPTVDMVANFARQYADPTFASLDSVQRRFQNDSLTPQRALFCYAGTTLQESPVRFCETSRKLTMHDRAKHSLTTAVYDTKRYPSWCDRILYAFCAAAPVHSVPDTYQAVRVSELSDHDLVCQLFLIDSKKGSALQS